MIYGEKQLAGGVVSGNFSTLPSDVTRHEPSLYTRILARHHGNFVNIAETTFMPGEHRSFHTNDDVDELLIVTRGIIEVSLADDIVTLDSRFSGYVFIPHGVPQAERNAHTEVASLLSIAIRNESFVHLNQHLTE